MKRKFVTHVHKFGRSHGKDVCLLRIGYENGKTVWAVSDAFGLSTFFQSDLDWAITFAERMVKGGG